MLVLRSHPGHRATARETGQVAASLAFLGVCKVLLANWINFSFIQTFFFGQEYVHSITAVQAFYGWD